MSKQVDNGTLITLSNDLTKASYRLGVNEIRLILVVLGQLPKDTEERIDPNKPYYITKTDFIKMGVAPNNVVHEIRSACNNLMERIIQVDMQHGVFKFHWVQNVFDFKTENFKELRAKYPKLKNNTEFMDYLRKCGLKDTLAYVNDTSDNVVARIVLSKDIIPFVSQLSSHFTQLQLHEFAGFGSFYSFRIFILMMQWRDTGRVFIKIDELRVMLDLVGKYKSIADLKRKVLGIAVDDINKHSSYKVSYKMTNDSGKQGRGIKLTHLEFVFGVKSKPIKKDELLPKKESKPKLPKKTPVIVDGECVSKPQPPSQPSVDAAPNEPTIDDLEFDADYLSLVEQRLMESGEIDSPLLPHPTLTTVPIEQSGLVEQQSVDDGQISLLPVDEVVIKKTKKDIRQELIQELFEYWKELSGQKKLVLDKKRIGYFNGRLDNGYTPEQIKNAMRYVATNKWHCENGHVHLHLAIRSNEQIDQQLQSLNKSNSGMVNQYWQTQAENVPPSPMVANARSLDDFFIQGVNNHE